MTPLSIPDTMPAFAREYLRLLDEAVSKTVGDASITSTSFRNSAALYRDIGKAWEATGADDTAELIERDPRLYVAGIMRNSTPDGNAKYFLHLYLELLEKQLASRKVAA